MKQLFCIILLLVPLVLCAQNKEQDSLYRQLELASTDSAKVYWLNQLSFHYRNSDPDKALQLGQDALALAVNLPQKLQLSDCYNSIAIALRKKGEFSKALEYFLKALRLREAVGDSSAMAVTYGNIATVYNNLKKYKDALPFFERAIAIFNQQGNRVKAGAIYNNMGVTYEHTGDLDRALRAYFKSLALLEELGDSVNMAARYNNIGVVYEKQKKFAEAIRHQKMALAIQEGAGDSYGASISCYNLGSVYIKTASYTEAASWLNRAITVSSSIDDAEGLQMSYYALSELYQKKGDYEKALNYYHLQAAYKDSLFSAGNQKQVAELQTRYETEKKEQAIQLLSKEQLVQEITLRKKQTIQHVVLAGLVAVVLLLIFLYRLYLQKRAANERLVQLDKEKNEFLGIAAHDLKNPLQTILGYCQMQVEYFDKLTKEKILKYNRNIDLSAKRMVELINNLLDINAIEEGRVKYNPEDIDLNDFFNNMMKEFEVQAGQKNIRISLQSEGSNYHVHTDTRMFGQVAENLLSNAIKYSPPGSVVMIKLLKEAGKAGFEVQDQGPGFTEQDKKKLFGKFTRLSAKPTGGESSVGLGLSIVKRMVELMGAEISVISEAGKGATFRVIAYSNQS